ncbi:MAG: hypothetical protein EOO38_00865 [Cytophagaceae bacterium]|nr:MAG: hypothetical protein EOO38_00865 [Cytophagaceae bacterium]
MDIRKEYYAAWGDVDVKPVLTVQEATVAMTCIEMVAASLSREFTDKMVAKSQQLRVLKSAQKCLQDAVYAAVAGKTVASEKPGND